MNPEESPPSNDAIVAQWQAQYSPNDAIVAKPLSQAQIRGLLTCTICLEPSCSPIYACKDYGHLTCAICYDRLPHPNARVNCPLCKSSPLEINGFAERLSRQNDMSGRCPFGGCGSIVEYAHMKGHLEGCEFRDIKCTEDRITGKTSVESCKKTFSLVEFPQHLISHHGIPLAEGELTRTFLFPKPLSEHDEPARNWWKVIPVEQYGPTTNNLIQFDNKFFNVHGAVGYYNLFWWVTLFGGQEEAKEYSYQTSLISNVQDNSVLTRPVLPYNRFEEFDPMSCNKYGMAHGMTVAECAKIQENGHKFYANVWVKIVKNGNSNDSDSGLKRQGEEELQGQIKKYKS